MEVGVVEMVEEAEVVGFLEVGGFLGVGLRVLL
jgi:hypothetical protein